MKKLFVVLMTLALLVGVAFTGYAASIVAEAGSNGIGSVKTYTTINTSAFNQVTNVPTTTIVPGRTKILGYTAMVYFTGVPDGSFSLRDFASTTSGNSDNLIIAENEAVAGTPVSQFWPALAVMAGEPGIGIVNGLTIHQGGKTVVTVYYIQTVP
jgi:hypothetical protein